MSAKDYRAECACSDRTNGAKGRVRRLPRGAGPQLVGSRRNRKCPRIPAGFAHRSQVDLKLCYPPASVPGVLGVKTGATVAFPFPPVSRVYGGLLSFPARAAQALLPTDLGMEPIAHEALCPPIRIPGGGGGGSRIGSSKVIPGLVVFETSLNYTSQKPKPSPTNQ